MILIICLSSSSQRNKHYGHKDIGCYEKQVTFVHTAGQVIDRHRDTNPKPAVTLVISMLAVEKYNG